MDTNKHTLANYSESSLKALLQAIPDLVWLKNADGVYLACNHYFEKFFGAKESEIVGRTDYDFMPKETADSFRKHDLLAISRGGPSTNEEWVTFADDGHRELVETTKTPVFNAQGTLIGVLGICHDITQRKHDELFEKFRSSMLEIIAGDTALPVILESIVRGVEQLRPEMACSILLLDSDGTHFHKGIAPSLPDFFNETLEGLEIGLGVGSCGTAAFTGERVVVENIATHPYWENFAALAAQAELGACWSEPILSSAHKVFGTFAIYHRQPNSPTAADLYLIEQSARLASIAIRQKKMEERMQHLAFHDALTGLPNRLLLNDRLEQTKAVSKRNGHYAALLFLDLDNFKPLNDQYGHDAGDLLLQQVAGRICNCVRNVDTVARFGGDEFVVIMSELNSDRTESVAQAGAVAEKIRMALLAPYIVNIGTEGEPSTVQHHCTTSIGVVLFNHQDKNDTDIIKWADLAMYQAKSAGRNRVQFYDPNSFS